MRRFALALTLCAAPLAAQSPADTAAVPRDLVDALLGESWLGGRLVVGRMPDGFPREALPPSAGRVLGGTAGGPDGATVVVAVPPGTDDVVEWLRAGLASAGFRPPPPRERQRGGFVSSEPAGRPAFVCRGAEEVAALQAGRGGGERLAVVRYSRRTAGRTSCDVDAGPAAFERAERDRALPTVVMPRGVGVAQSGGGGGMNERWMTARAQASGPPGELLDVLAAQLKDSAWVLGPRLASQTLAVQSAERLDAQGRRVAALLSVMLLPGISDRDLMLRVVWPESQPR